jgi:hypothetical protein
MWVATSWDDRVSFPSLAGKRKPALPHSDLLWSVFITCGKTYPNPSVILSPRHRQRGQFKSSRTWFVCNWYLYLETCRNSMFPSGSNYSIILGIAGTWRCSSKIIRIDGNSTPNYTVLQPANLESSSSLWEPQITNCECLFWLRRGNSPHSLHSILAECMNKASTTAVV